MTGSIRSATAPNRHVPGEPGIWVLILGDMGVFGLFFASYKAGAGGDRDSLGRYYNFPSRERLERFYAEAGPWSELTIETGTGGGYDGVPRTTFNVMAAR